MPFKISEEQNVKAISSSSSSPISLSLSIGGRDFTGKALRPPTYMQFVNIKKTNLFCYIIFIFNSINVPGALIGFLDLLPTVLVGLLTAVRVLLTTVFLLIVADVFLSTLLEETLAGFDTGSFTTMSFAVITAFSDASLI